jgi:hypothetical protein
MLLLLVQTALAAFLGFLATIHWDEANRFLQRSGMAYVPVEKATLRYQMEGAAAVVDAVCAVVAALLLLLVIGRANRLPSVRPAFRLAGGLFLAAATVLFFAAFGVPRVGSPHDDMFAGLGFFISSAPLLLMCGCSFGVARLVKASSPV